MFISKILATLFILFSSCVPFALAAENFDIDLKELRPASAAKPAARQQNLEIDLKELRTVKPKKSKTRNVKHKAVVKAAATAEMKKTDSGKSSYTMQPGDHLALVLVRNYGLSEVEARRLMPEIMHLNSISNPQHIAVGQRLIIPLAPAAGPEQQKIQEAAIPVKHAVVTVVSATATFTDACSLARQVSDKLGILVLPATLEMGSHLFTARYDGVGVTLACDPTPAEVITYGRLLVMYGESLLVIDSKDSGSRVVEKLAESLGLSFVVTGSQKQGGQPLEYLFFGMGTDRHEIRLTLKPLQP